MKDNHDNILAAVALNATQMNTNTTAVGPILDRNTFESLEYLLYTGAWTTGTFTASLQDGNASNLSDAAAVAENFLLPHVNSQANGVAYTSAVLNGANQVKRLGYVGSKRYVQLTITSTSVVSTGALVGALAILGSPDFSPTAAN